MIADWDGAVNLSSYDQVESPENYRNAAELEAYRSERLAFCARRAEFALKISGARLPVDVVEIGAGSSALLYAMESMGALKRGLAIELSASRHRFAERWRQEKGFQNVVNHCTDFAQAALENDTFDLFLCIDNTFSYIGPENPSYPRRLVESAFASLNPGGCLVIETHNQEKVLAAMRDGERRFWKEMPNTNVFKFALYRQSLNRSKNLIRSESIYLRRDGAERRKTEIETAHTRAMIEELLRSTGFSELRFFGDYDLSGFEVSQSEYLIALARKPVV